MNKINALAFFVVNLLTTGAVWVSHGYPYEVRCLIVALAYILWLLFIVRGGEQQGKKRNANDSENPDIRRKSPESTPDKDERSQIGNVFINNGYAYPPRVNPERVTSAAPTKPASNVEPKTPEPNKKSEHSASVAVNFKPAEKTPETVDIPMRYRKKVYSRLGVYVIVEHKLVCGVWRGNDCTCSPKIDVFKSLL